MEHQVWAKVQSLVTDPAQLRSAIERARGSQDDAALQLELQRRAIATAESQITRLIDLLGNAGTPAIQKPLRTKLEKLSTEIAAVQARILELEEQRAITVQAAGGLRGAARTVSRGPGQYLDNGDRRGPRAVPFRHNAESAGLYHRGADGAASGSQETGSLGTRGQDCAGRWRGTGQPGYSVGVNDHAQDCWKLWIVNITKDSWYQSIQPLFEQDASFYQGAACK